MKRFAIFKSGSHTAMGGQALTFSEADLQAAVRVYDPAKHEAPLTVGHPKDNLPAYGWVGSLSFADSQIQVEPKEVEPQFAEMVQTGRFKKRSASFYAPNSASHPLAGTADHNTYYLRHVAFLGAQPPAVKGLKDVEFADAEGTVEFEEDWVVAGILARLFSNLRDYLISTAGLEKADQLLPKYAIEDLGQHAKDTRPNPGAIPMFSEENSMTPEEIAAMKAANAKLTADLAAATASNTKLAADFAESQKKQADADKLAVRADIKSKIEGLVKAGKVTPAEVETLTDFAAAQDDASATFEFGEGDAKKKLTARALFLQQLETRPVSVDFSERSGRELEPGDPVAKASQKIMDQVSGKKVAA